MRKLHLPGFDVTLRVLCGFLVAIVSVPVNANDAAYPRYIVEGDSCFIEEYSLDVFQEVNDEIVVKTGQIASKSFLLLSGKNNKPLSPKTQQPIIP